ncbi:3-oxoacyl-ACP synthase [Sphingobacterium sp. lm-10]|uniref:3-oxoacyl-ACP synthase n=1 Tax=Sphingobacterium sp. lm-10 TaxID=2944904 RepID=UPI0020205B14|nr:3-oxoacyl-ACP synthase [Sphingobacterium sp. lm-10]MCL7986484.1 3-oxoacyl-ACP synthase [Sphingobacterium sp. lm-10]
MEKIKQIETSLDLSQDSLISDTKSSAGDKYETSREMIQQDLDRLQRQLKEAQKDQQVLQSIPSLPPTKENRARLGSLVKTETGLYFLSIGIGKVTCLDQIVFVVSLQSPIGQLLLGKGVGDSFTFQQKSHVISAIQQAEE